MTREELVKVLFASSVLPTGATVERVQAKQYEPETVRVTCSSCGTRFRVLRWQESRPWLDKHLAACATKTEEERQFYRENRRWPAVILGAVTLGERPRPRERKRARRTVQMSAKKP